jgi:hypothetical protein
MLHKAAGESPTVAGWVFRISSSYDIFTKDPAALAALPSLNDVVFAGDGSFAAVVPEPASCTLFGSALLLLGGHQLLRRRRRA